MLYLIKNGTATRWTGQPIDGITHPRNIGQLWSAAELEAIGLVDVQPLPEPDAPIGKITVRDSEPSLVDGEWVYGWTFEDTITSASDVDAERDSRIDGGFTFAGTKYQTRPQDRENISGASVAALAAIMNGAQADDYRWHGEPKDFAFIASDNSKIPMDAQTMFAFGQAAMAHKSAHIFAARDIKNLDPIPADYADDAHWPN